MLSHRTLAVYLTKMDLVVATTCACLVLSSATGATLAECTLPSFDGIDNTHCRAQLPAVEWPAAQILPSADSGVVQVGRSLSSDLQVYFSRVPSGLPPVPPV